MTLETFSLKDLEKMPDCEFDKIIDARNRYNTINVDHDAQRIGKEKLLEFARDLRDQY